VAVTPAVFLQSFPEFSTYKLQESAIQFWITYAQVLLNQARWGMPAPVGQPLAMYDYGVMFHTAHNIALGMQAFTQVVPPDTPGAATTGVPGLTVGVMSHKQVDKVSANYDIKAVLEAEGAGNWNATSYGQRFIRLARQFGSAPLPVTPASGGADMPLAWAGPGFPFPGWFAW
jgi:hypothetical protein